MSVKVTMNSNWQKVVKGQFTQDGLLEMVTDIHRRAVALAPVETSALRNSGVIDKVSGGYSVTFGGSRVPYARRRHYENKKNPHTKRYLTRAGDSVTRGDTGKYWRGKI